MKKFNTKFKKKFKQNLDNANNNAFIPNSFQITNAFVDNIMDKISDASVKIYLITVRKTTGWGKQVDSISLTQYEAYSGKSRPTVVRCLKELVSYGLLVEHKGTRYGNSYSVALVNSIGFELLSASKNILLVKTFNYTSKKTLLPLVKIFNTQKQLSKNTNQKQINKGNWFSVKTLKDELFKTGLQIESEDLTAAKWFDREKTAFENYAPNQNLTDPQKMYYFVDWLLKSKRKYEVAASKQAAKAKTEGKTNTPTEKQEGEKNPYLLTDKQVPLFARKLSRLGSFGLNEAPAACSYEELEIWCIGMLKRPDMVKKWKKYLNEIGFKFDAVGEQK